MPSPLGPLPFLFLAIPFRPLPRIALAASDVIPAGARLTFTVDILNHPPAKGQKEPEVTAAVLRQLMEELGCKRGIGQWRTASFGVYVIKEWKVQHL